MLKEINLSIVNGCNANCTFCPRDMIPTKNKKFMPLKLVRLIVDEISSKSFKKSHDVVHMVIGENGEPTLHKEFIPILREVKRLGIQVDLYTNFSGLTPERIDTIISEGLVSTINTNIDGSSSETYTLMKGLEWEKVKENILYFLNAKGREAIPLSVHVVTPYNYMKAVQKHFGIRPRKIPANFNPKVLEHIEIQTWLESYPNVSVCVDSCLMWSERFNTNKKHGQFNCFNLPRLETNAFINPDGEWYLCCFDMANELVIGSIIEKSINELYHSNERARLLSLLKDGKFDDIGSPCNRVDCCQVVHWS